VEERRATMRKAESEGYCHCNALMSSKHEHLAESNTKGYVSHLLYSKHVMADIFVYNTNQVMMVHMECPCNVSTFLFI